MNYASAAVSPKQVVYFIFRVSSFQWSLLSGISSRSSARALVVTGSVVPLLLHAFGNNLYFNICIKFIYIYIKYIICQYSYLGRLHNFYSRPWPGATSLFRTASGLEPGTGKGAVQDLNSVQGFNLFCQGKPNHSQNAIPDFP